MFCRSDDGVLAVDDDEGDSQRFPTADGKFPDPTIDFIEVLLQVARFSIAAVTAAALEAMCAEALSLVALGELLVVGLIRPGSCRRLSVSLKHFEQRPSEAAEP